MLFVLLVNSPVTHLSEWESLPCKAEPNRPRSWGESRTCKVCKGHQGPPRATKNHQEPPRTTDETKTRTHKCLWDTKTSLRYFNYLILDLRLHLHLHVLLHTQHSMLCYTWLYLTLRYYTSYIVRHTHLITHIHIHIILYVCVYIHIDIPLKAKIPPKKNEV